MWEYNEELKHYGVLGMKWGVRKDRGPKGGSRKKINRVTDINKRPKPRVSEDYIKSRVIKRKKASELSNMELQEYSNRMTLEQNYKRLNPGKIATTMALAGTAVATAGVYMKTYEDGKQILDKILKKKRQ